jgi:endonuclease/exonuclease/phosphatase family metal-dependent hydrolase
MSSVRWIQPQHPAERARLDPWCAGVGPPLFVDTPVAPARSRNEPSPRLDELMIASWNVHVGAGDLDRFLTGAAQGALTAGRRPAHLVVLLQEAVRSAGVPDDLPAGGVAAARIGTDAWLERSEIGMVATRFGMSLLYVPSMRNGAGPPRTRRRDGSRSSASDRGNAILSTLPLFDPLAIELAGKRQRRVAVCATVKVTIDGAAVPVSFGSAHLDTLAGPRSLWVGGAMSARSRQAASLAEALPQGVMILGADLNTWMGSREPAVRRLKAAFPSTPVDRARRTFRGLTLDYVFFRLPSRLRPLVKRAASRYGSDHYPLIAEVRDSEEDPA